MYRSTYKSKITVTYLEELKHIQINASTYSLLKNLCSCLDM